MPNNDLGKLIYRHDDEIGPITVFAKQHLRYLTFGNKIEQSCVNLVQPHRLEHAYTQAMLLSLLLSTNPRNVLILGLGGGSLLRALHFAQPKLAIHAIESRQSVIDVAREHFSLPDSPKVTYHCIEAEFFLDETNQAFDIIFSDLYLAEKVHESQQSLSFYQNCYEKLPENGLLTVNQWSGEFKSVKHCHQILSEVFDKRVFNLHVKGGNHISFAFKGTIPDIDRKPFFAAAQNLGCKLDIPLQQLSRNFWKQNADALKIRRFSDFF